MRTINKRRKAFIGAAIGLASSVIGGLISSNKQKKAQERQNRIQNRKETYQQANALTDSYANQDYVDDFQDRIQFACGGRRKKEDGGTEPIKPVNTTPTKTDNFINWKDELHGGIDAGLNGIGNIISTALMRNGGLRKRR